SCGEQAGGVAAQGRSGLQGRPCRPYSNRKQAAAQRLAAAQPARTSDGQCTPRYTREVPTRSTPASATGSTGQRQRVRQASSTSTQASVALPMACPLGKLKVSSGAIDSHRDGRSRANSALVPTFNSAEP